MAGPAPVGRPGRTGRAGVAGVYTPKDFDLNQIIGEIIDLVRSRASAGATA